MNDYQKRGAYTTLEEYVLAKTGGRIDELDRNRKYEVGGLSHAAAMLQLAKRRGTAVYLYTDSDLDGSGAMYSELLGNKFPSFLTEARNFSCLTG